MTADKIKVWLLRFASMEREAALLRVRADTIRQRATSPTSPTLDGLPRAPGFEGDRIGGIIGTADILDREAAAKEQEAADVYVEIDTALHQIGGKYAAEIRTALQARYLDGLPWSDVSYMLFGDREDFLQKEDTFLRRTMQYHKRGIEALIKILEEEKNE